MISFPAGVKVWIARGVTEYAARDKHAGATGARRARP